MIVVTSFVCVCIIYSYNNEGTIGYRNSNTNQARIQLVAKGEVVKIMDNNVLLPQAANVSDRMPRKRVPQPARMSFSGYIL